MGKDKEDPAAIYQDPNTDFVALLRNPRNWGWYINTVFDRMEEDDRTLLAARLGSKGLGDDGSKELFKAMQKNFGLTHLDVSRNGFGPDAFRLVSRCLISNEQIKFVDLSENPLGVVGLGYFSEPLLHNQSVLSFHLRKCQLNPVAGKFLHEIIHFNNYLTDVDVSGNQLGSAGATPLGSSLAHTYSLTRLNVSDNEIGDKGLRQLASGLTHNQSVKILEVASNNIGPMGIRAFCLILEDTFSRLEVLDLSHNFLGYVGVQDLMEHFSHLAELQYLSLRNNEILAEGMWYICQAMKHIEAQYNQLTALDVSENNIGIHGYRILRELLAPPPDAFEEKRAGRPLLKQLDVTANMVGENGGKFLLDALRRTTTLTSIFFGSTGLTDEQVEETHEIIETNREKVGLPKFGGASRRGRNRPKFWSRRLTAAEERPFNFEIMGPDPVVNVADSGISGPDVCKNLAAYLSRKVNLTQLDLSGNKFSIDDLHIVCQSVVFSRTLTTLDLSCNNLRESGALLMGRLLEHSKALEHLYLADNNMGDEGAGEVYEGLKKSATVKVLSLEWNGITQGDPLAALLKQNTTLQTLYMGGNNLGDSGVERLCSELDEHVHITHLDLTANKIGDNGATHLVNLLKNRNAPKALKTLDIGRNPMNSNLYEMIRLVMMRKADA